MSPREKILASAQEHTANGNLAEAVADYRTLLDSEPDDIQVLEKLLSLHHQQEDFAQAETIRLRLNALRGSLPATEYADEFSFDDDFAAFTFNETEEEKKAAEERRLKAREEEEFQRRHESVDGYLAQHIKTRTTFFHRVLDDLSLDYFKNFEHGKEVNLITIDNECVKLSISYRIHPEWLTGEV